MARSDDTLVSPLSSSYLSRKVNDCSENDDVVKVRVNILLKSMRLRFPFINFYSF